MSQDSTDPFATDSTIPDSDPFGGSSGSSDGDFTEYDVPPTPVGVLVGFCKSVKKQKTEKNGTTKENLIFEFACSEPEFKGASTTSVFIEVPRFIKRAASISAALGIPITQQGGKVRLPSLDSYKDKPCLIVYSTYTGGDGAEQPTIAWGCPKPGQSVAFDEWLAVSGLSDDQIKVIKASPGIMPIGALG